MAEISSDILRGYTDIIVLSILLEEDSYGYEISKKIAKISEDKLSMKETTLYSAFKRLEKFNFIESYKDDQIENSRRTYYRMTKEGKKYYQSKVEEWQLTKEIINKFTGR